MYIEASPKKDLGSLYNRDAEKRDLRRYIKQKQPLILITGLRRVGKTSLLRSVLSAHVKHYIFMDLRSFGSETYISKKDIANTFQIGVQRFLDSQRSKAEKLKSRLLTVRGINFPGGAGIQFDFGKENGLDIWGLFDRLDRWAEDSNVTIVVAIDEAQEFRKSVQVNMAKVFAGIYDNHSNIIMVLTGSEVGVFQDFLAMENPDAPLYGRSRVEIRLNPMTHEQGVDFLAKGLKQHKIRGVDPDVLSHAVKEIGGIIGWLNDFGLACVRNGRVDKRFIGNIKRTGSAMARSEFDAFLSNRKAAGRYNAIMGSLGGEHLSWARLKKSLENDTGRNINSRNFASLLNTLQGFGFVEKDGEAYRIIDPMLRYSFERSKGP